MVRVGINGFGRIGRLFLRACIEKCKQMERSKPTQVVAINDPFMEPEQMRYLFKYDSTHGIFCGDVANVQSCLLIDGQRIETTQEKDPKKIPWKNTKVDYVIEASGKYLSCRKAGQHLRDTVKRVIITAPSKDCPTFIVGVNHDCYNPSMFIVSHASCTTNCMAPLLKVIHDHFSVQEAMMSTIHSVTITQNVLDGPAKKWRSGRGALQNIIPSTTGADKAIAKIIPDLKGKIKATAFRVPVADVSVIDLTIKVGKQAPMELVNCKIKEAANTYMKGILGYTEEEVVSSDFISDTRSCIYDAKASIALSHCFIKLVAWYDNEYGYASRIVDFVEYIESQENCPPCKKDN